VLCVFLISLLFFMVATSLCRIAGLFDEDALTGLWHLAAIVLYLIVWLLPTCFSWAVWATWLK
jgi:hypothetical protein